MSGTLRNDPVFNPNAAARVLVGPACNIAGGNTPFTLVSR